MVTHMSSDMLVQGSANPQTPGSENKRIKSCVLLPATVRRTQLFILLFLEPGVCGFANSCTLSHPVLVDSLTVIRAVDLLNL